ncbi:MAG: aminoacetone oxidase family FAD-binding enzyme [Oscillospiraceae bacterium]|nr:aminoacetone oxidase family FAD-binding enzyme [Oscillospiraceae bacterium]
MGNVITADIVILGGGASGLAAAVSAKRTAPYARVLIAERLDRVGKKILATGNGRCNLSNKNLSAASYHGSVKNIMEIIEQTPSAEEFFASLGVVCTADAEGRIYPYSRSAASVLTALRLKISSLGIEEMCGFYAVKIEINGGGFRIYSEDNSVIECGKIIAACGGYAAPSFGTDGNAIKLFRSMGYRTEKVCPAVAPLRVSPEELKGLKGVRAKCRVSAVSDGRILRAEKGEIQFTDNSLSGICVFNLAHIFSEYEGRLSLSVDFMPEISRRELEELLWSIKEIRSDCPLEDFLSGIFAKNLAVYIIKKAAAKPLTEKTSSLGRREIINAVSLIKALEFKVTGCSSWQNAQVTLGGISGACVDEGLQSKTHKGIYFAGEILDVCGDCGGFNLEWAWSSGIWAGEGCAKSISRKG